MPTVGQIFACLQAKAPIETKLDFDNVGLLVGSPDWDVKKVLLSLDITDPVVEEAKKTGAQLIVSHHPLFFGLKNIGSLDPQGIKAMNLLTGSIAAVCMHTNLDAADGGVNDALAAALDVREAKTYEPEHICRIGALPEPLPLPEFLRRVKTALGCNGIRYVDGGKPVRKVALCGGSGGSFLEETANTGCDTFVTADVKYDVFLRAKELGLNLIDAGHFNTENVVIPVLKQWISEAFPGVEVVISKHTQTEQYYV